MTAANAFALETADDATLAARASQRDAEAVRLITTRNNQRLFRAAWSILKNRAEAEEAVQEGYLKAFAAMAGFKGESSLSTWLTRIVINEAIGRRRAAERRRRQLNARGVAVMEEYSEALMRGSASSESQDAALIRRQMAGFLERAIAGLPEPFRLVLVMRDIEEMSVEETAEALQIPPQTVKTRLFRARRRLRLAMDPELREAAGQAFQFAGADCEAMTARVLRQLGLR
jgi:RNA polymerase sigma-70 factor (ECF subfamily)